MQDSDNLFLIVMAFVAGFIILQLRRTLGRKDGYDGKDEERQNNPFEDHKADQQHQSENVIPLRGAQQDKSEFQERIDDSKEIGVSKSSPFYGTLEDIRRYDRSFTLPSFIDGAEYAYGMILNAFWTGDLKTLRTFLSRDVFKQFEGAINDMKEQGHVFENKIDDIEKIELEEASINGSMAELTLKFSAHMTISIKDKDGNAVSGDDENSVPVIDVWTFCRDVKRSDPNWTLVATSNA